MVVALRIIEVADSVHQLLADKDWYDGYLFGNTEIYNPWSILNYTKSVLSGNQISFSPVKILSLLILRHPVTTPNFR